MTTTELYPHPANEIETCVICWGSSRRLFRKHGYWIRGCNCCNHRFAEISIAPTHVAQVYGDQYFQGGGAGYPDYLAESSLLRQHGQRYARLLARYTTPGRMLDIGAAAGFMLQGFVDAGWQGNGIEPNPGMASFAKTRLGLTVETGTLENLTDDENYDLITMIQVVAHFFDVHQSFRAASLHTKPGGLWLIETWNRKSFTARILGKRWHEYSPPSVLHWFSPDDLKELAAQYGFYEVARGRPEKWLNGAHAKSLLRYKLEGVPLKKMLSKMLDLISDKLPIPYPSEDLFWILLKRS